VNWVPLSGALGESLSSGYNFTSSAFNQIRANLLATGAGYVLPSTSPETSLTDKYYVPKAEAVVLGLFAPSSTADGSIFIGSAVNWFSNEGFPVSNAYDLFGTILHEVTEVLGRQSGVTNAVSGALGLTPMDLFRYHGTGANSVTLGDRPYFSIDGGATSLGAWNGTSTADAGDWSSVPGTATLPGQHDALNGYGSLGAVASLSAVDITLLNALGYHTIPNDVIVTDATGPVATTVSIYAGPVAGLDFQFINTGASPETITATQANTFVHGGTGNDTIDFSGVGGNNVLDGGTGTNLLIGSTNAASQDTFFLDARGPSADTWSTVVNFHKNDAVTIWGITSANALNWADGQGAAGHTGLTSHISINGHNESVTLAGFTTADLGNGHFSQTYGTDVNGNHFLQIIELL